MRALHFCSFAIVTVTLLGCTEMRVEGDAKVFQSSAVGALIRTVIGLGLIGLGALAIAGAASRDRKPKQRKAKPNDGLTSNQRLGMTLFGVSMAFMGLFLAGASLLFPSKLHVTVYPDRVSMASTYSQTGGREVVIPFSSLASVELRDELNIVGKLTTYLVFTQKNGDVIRLDAGNNERKAVDTIKNALAAFSGSSSEGAAPATSEGSAVVASPAPEMSAVGSNDFPVSPRIEMPTQETPAAAPRPSFVFPPVASSSPADDKAASKSEQYSLKRYEITIPVPAGSSVVGPDTIVEVGRKLKACYAGSWSTVTVVAVNSDGTLSCNWDSYPTYTYRMMREDLIIEAQNGTPTPSEVPSKQYSLKRYKITIPVPADYAVVDASSDVKVGMKLGACYAGSWSTVTVVAINDDGTITCNWDSYSSFTYKMMREDLILKTPNGNSTPRAD